MVQQQEQRPWIRGVNLGGWLLAERFIAPYLFALTTCHLEGNFCWYPGQLSAPPKDAKICDLYHCKPIIANRTSGKLDYPIDEYTLLNSFDDKTVARRYMEYHWDNFVTLKNIETLSKAGVTHIRVPLPHYIMGDILPDEPWVDGQWMYLIRLVSWCRRFGMQVWPDLHTAPGSQNGFDNSGQFLGGPQPTCKHWSDSKQNVERTLKAVQDICNAIVRDGLDDVVTGFGILNEPFKDCDLEVVKDYNTRALKIVRDTLGSNAAVYMGDLFNATIWNDGAWWVKENNTYLDSHYYHVFDERPRALSPRQHLAFVCQKQHRDTTSCCYQESDNSSSMLVPSTGVSRIIGEWSASFDTLVDAQLDQVMQGIHKTGVAPFFHRNIENARKDFLKHYVEAQMVTYEAVHVGVSSGWFYWTLKTEGGAFAEWDFLRGLNEGWIPNPLPSSNTSSTDLFGSCYDIMFDTKDDMSIVHEYPDASSLDPNNWQGVDINDDVVVSHGESLNKKKRAKQNDEVNNNNHDAYSNKPTSMDRTNNNHYVGPQQQQPATRHPGLSFLSIIAVGFLCVYTMKTVFSQKKNRQQYMELRQESREIYV